MSDHSWCRDVQRDEAVRAAEDGRSGPLPTLEAVIAQPFAEAAKCSSAVSETGEGQSGLRTERVVLDVTHQCFFPAAEWVLEIVQEACSDPGESVRVVDETDRLEVRVSVLQAAVESARDDRDAAIRERDRIREDAKADHNIAKAALDERDAAIRERDEFRSEITSVRNGSHLAHAANDVLRTRVAELEAERDNRATIDEVAHQRDTLQARVNRLEENLAGEKARVAELEAEKAAAIQRAEAAELFHESQKDMMTYYVSRIEALNLRCELRDWAVKHFEARVAELESETNGLRGDVKAAEKEAERLGEQLDAVACRAADAEKAMEAATAVVESFHVEWVSLGKGLDATLAGTPTYAPKAVEGFPVLPVPDMAPMEAAPAASGWRMLEVGETLQDGDQWFDDPTWFTTNDVGLPNSGARVYRRRVPATAASDAAGKSVGSELVGRLARFADRVEVGEIEMPQGPPRVVQSASGAAGNSVPPHIEKQASALVKEVGDVPVQK